MPHKDVVNFMNDTVSESNVIFCEINETTSFD